jgi:hypothetical protein
MSLNLRRTINNNNNVELSNYTIDSLLAELEGAELAMAA